MEKEVAVEAETEAVAEAEVEAVVEVADEETKGKSSAGGKL